MSSNQQTTPAGGTTGHNTSAHGVAPKKKKSNSATSQFIWLVAIIILLVALWNLSNISHSKNQNPTEENKPTVSDHTDFEATYLIDKLVKQTGSTTLTVTKEGVWVSVIGKMNVYTPTEIIFDDGAGHLYTLNGNKFGDNKPSPDVQRWLLKSSGGKTAKITFTKN